MSPRSCCPACSSRRVESFMDYAGHRVDYFHCLDCHHIWNVPKGEDGPINHVTPLPEPMKMSAHTNALFERANRAIGERHEASARHRALVAARRIPAMHAQKAIAEIAQIWQQISGNPKWSGHRRIRSIPLTMALKLAIWRRRLLSAA